MKWKLLVLLDEVRTLVRSTWRGGVRRLTYGLDVPVKVRYCKEA